MATFETAFCGEQATAPARYSIRQALDQEYQKLLIRQRADAAQSRFKAGSIPGQIDEPSSAVERFLLATDEGKKPKVAATRRDFFGRIVNDAQPQSLDSSNSEKNKNSLKGNDDNKVWVSFHEGFSNAVRKPITLEELMRGF